VADGYRCRWLQSAWDTPQSGRQRMFTRTRCAATTMRRRGVGTSFSVGAPATACQEKSNKDRRRPRAFRSMIKLSSGSGIRSGPAMGIGSYVMWTSPREPAHLQRLNHGTPKARKAS
jgi:hypothetical protein